MSDPVVLTVDELRDRCVRSLRSVGASEEQAAVLAEATVQAEMHGRRAVGVAHLLDYLDGFTTGRISAGTTPTLSARTDVVMSVDCAGGLAQHGFVEALPWLTEAAGAHGIAIVGVSRCFTAGEVGFYIRSLAERGLVGIALANSPALMSVGGSHDPLFGTNPLAFGAPLPEGRMVGFDQASSAMAWVGIRDAAERGEPLAPGMAVDRSGAATTSAAAAKDGSLLPFGGYKGGNVALLVELLAVLAGGEFSCEAGPFDRGSVSPSSGLLIIALAPERFATTFGQRTSEQLQHWQESHGADTSRWVRPIMGPDHVTVDSDLLERLP